MILLTLTGSFLILYMSIWALIAISKSRLDIADVAWGGGFILVAWSAFFVSSFSWQALVVNICISIWGVRLSWHIFQRHRQRDEDFRYQIMKKGWKKHLKIQVFFKVFYFQGFILYVIALPIIWIQIEGHNIEILRLIGSLFIWLSGFLLETVADYQLMKFKDNVSHKGQLYQKGLWSYSRHPNYLGEIIQWVAIWSLTLSSPMGWALIVSPLLISYLIIQVTGVAPLEKKMASHSDFISYSKKTPILAPLSLLNGIIYSIAWFIIIFYGAQGYILVPLVTGLGCYFIELVVLFKSDKNAFLMGIPISIYALCLGGVQEMIFIHFPVLQYSYHHLFPPFWILLLYPLFALSCGFVLKLLDRNLIGSFFVSGAFGVFFYCLGEKMGAVSFLSINVYPIVFLFWAFFMVILILLNRKLSVLTTQYFSPQELNRPITVFFDGLCSICSNEMQKLQKRKQTGIIHYVSVLSETDLKKITQKITYIQAMEKIHAIDADGHILKGIDVLSAMYARTDLPLLAIFLKSPGFYTCFTILYAAWAKLRRIQKND